ncbi:CubicO group peptidase, beta-lactamase class C family [Actinopolyspora xinjiangensis]|uniref:CubicO group peptidase, beta-lactamase class C family n=1 Tax=Actinopolyspora xinjiangensis TaxID=405564 RepID=A0A1H0WWN7_9ACTN|nr:serine hydrolase [Actinopolyspora xinjiangensis]SDP95174.1 CubicO group peptidase, beta-lactamase class C family [Actinopolyspora xinjiangensis]
MRNPMLVTALLSMLTVTTCASAPAPEVRGGGRFDLPHQGFSPSDTRLREASPREAGLAPTPIREATARIAEWTETTPEREHPMYAGAVSLLAHDGLVVSHEAAGYELRYADGKGTQLPPERREKVAPDTIFDLASMTKLFTSVAVLQQVERGRVGLDVPVAEYLPEFGDHGKSGITVRQLLTHTSGLQSVVRLWELPAERRIPHVMDLEPVTEPGSAYNYSDPNMIVLGELLERVTGRRLDRVVARGITEPLGMADTGYRPPRSKLHRTAATEFQSDPPRGMVHGRVHDENAWSLGGIAGHAGIFSTARDLAVLGQAILNGGTYGGERILSEHSVELMLTDHNTEFPEHSHGLGFELEQRWYMAGLTSPRGAGHTGYTGTSMVLDPRSRSMAILLTNRVHPSREWGSNNPARVALAQGLARSMAVEPRHGPTAWFTGGGTAHGETTLTTEPVRADSPLRVSFETFVDTQRNPDGVDRLRLEYSHDGGSSWHVVRMHTRGPGSPRRPVTELAGSGHRAWWRVRGTVPEGRAGEALVRWRFTPDERYVGRGVYLDGIRISAHGRTVLDGEADAHRLRGAGFLVAQR